MVQIYYSAKVIEITLEESDPSWVFLNQKLEVKRQLIEIDDQTRASQPS